MKILILANHYPVASGRYARDAFKRLGHDVRTDGLSMGQNIWGLQVDARYVWTPEPPEAGWTPELIITMDSDPAVLDDHYPMQQYPLAKRVVWGVDNHVRNYRRDTFQHYFLAHRNITQQPFDEQATWLPCAYDPRWFTPSLIPWEQREYDICLVGVIYERRARLVHKLQSAGLKVFAAMGLLYDEYRAAYHNSRASLCVSAGGDVAQRIFETGAMGCLVLTDPLHDLVDIKTGHTPATNKALGLAGFAVYSSDDECVSQAEQLIKLTPEMGMAGARLMQQRCQPHTWDARAQRIIEWAMGEPMVEPEAAAGGELVVKPVVVTDAGDRPQVVMVMAEKEEPAKIEAVETRKPYLNLGCGLTHLPGAMPPGHEIVPPEIYEYPYWVNVDKVDGVGADKTFDLFTYPWPLESNSFDGALLAHIAEHIPHEIKVHEERILPPGIVERGGLFFNAAGERVSVTLDDTRNQRLRQLQDGWYAFFSELYRVLTPGAKVWVLSPYGWSDGAITDPSHTRLLTANTFTHAMTPENNGSGTFRYETDVNLKIAGITRYRMTEPYRYLMPLPGDSAAERERKQEEISRAMITHINVVYDFCTELEAVK